MTLRLQNRGLDILEPAVDLGLEDDEIVGLLARLGDDTVFDQHGASRDQWLGRVDWKGAVR